MHKANNFTYLVELPLFNFEALVQRPKHRTYDLSTSKEDNVMLPIIAHESTVTCFDYWDGGIKKGMRDLKEIYTHVKSFALSDRTEAYDASNELAQKGVAVCLTVSKDSYSLWVCLRNKASLSIA